MKTWIIVLSILFIILFFIRTCVANYIKNDREESVRYYFLSGGTTLGVLHGIIYLIEKLVMFVDIILIIITVVNKFL